MSSTVLIQNITSPITHPPRVRLCDTFGCRLRGLMFRRSIGRDEGLLLVMSGTSRLDSSIHMLFVAFDLAVFWIDTNMNVVDKTIARSWRPAYMPTRAARYVLELHPDLFGAYDIGHKLDFAHV